MRDRQLCKTSISSERTLQTVTIAVMLVDCTKLVYPICQLSSNVIWLKTEMTLRLNRKKSTVYLYLINMHSTTVKRQYYLPLWLMYRLPFELTDSAKLLHFTILGGGSADPPPQTPLNDASGSVCRNQSSAILFCCGIPIQECTAHSAIIIMLLCIVMQSN